MVKGSLVQPARDGLFLIERLGIEPGRDLALRALPVRSVILDGEGVICGPMAAIWKFLSRE